MAQASTSVLIVDDNDDNRDLYEQYLSFNGFRVLTGRNGQEGIEVARKHHPTVIFLDVRMPGMSGLEVVQTLRTDPTFVHTPIVALTAHALRDEHLAFRAAGFDQVISKPCLPEDVVRAVERWTGSAATQRSDAIR